MNREQREEATERDPTGCRADLMHWPFDAAMADLRAIAHRFATADYDEAERALAARLMLLNILVEENVIAGLYRYSLRLLKLSMPVAKFVGEAEALSRELGFDGRLEMLQSRAAGAARWSNGVSRPGAASRLERFRAAEADLVEGMNRVANGKAVPGLFAGFCRALVQMELPWPWLAALLVHDLFESLLAWLCGASWDRVLELSDPLDESAPDLAVEIQTLPGESKREFLTRLRDECDRVLDGMALPDQPRRGRPPSTGVVERHVVWFAFQHLCGSPVSRIANYAFEDEGADRRSEVRRGIREAKRLLDLSPYTFTAEQLERFSRISHEEIEGGEKPL